MRAAAVRFVLTLLMGLLSASLFPPSGAPFSGAQARTPQIHLAAFPGAVPEGMRGEYGTCGTPDRGGESKGLLRHRDRHRPTVVPAPDAPSRSLVTTGDRGLLAPAAVAAMGRAHHTSRSSAAHSAPVLQVFRC